MSSTADSASDSLSTSTSAFFESLYQADADPWRFGSDPTELARYSAILGALAPHRYGRAFEPGCSVGVLTERLAMVCDAVEAIDFSQTALDRARNRCAHLGHVTFTCASLPERLPVAGFDLLVLSEIGYYFSETEWQRLAGEIIAAAASGTTLLACHWLGQSPDHQLSGDAVHAVLHANNLLHHEHAERHSTFRLDRWRRV